VHRAQADDFSQLQIGEVYQTSAPSFFAAAISAGVIDSGSGAAARTGAAKALIDNAADILRSRRRALVMPEAR
jgi:hypothetical protein